MSYVQLILIRSLPPRGSTIWRCWLLGSPQLGQLQRSQHTTFPSLLPGIECPTNTTRRGTGPKLTPVRRGQQHSLDLSSLCVFVPRRKPQTRGRSPYLPKEKVVLQFRNLTRLYSGKKSFSYFKARRLFWLGEALLSWIYILEKGRCVDPGFCKRKVNVLLSHSDACFLGKPLFTSMLDTTRLQAWP